MGRVLELYISHEFSWFLIFYSHYFLVKPTILFITICWIGALRALETSNLALEQAQFSTKHGKHGTVSRDRRSLANFRNQAFGCCERHRTLKSSGAKYWIPRTTRLFFFSLFWTLKPILPSGIPFCLQKPVSCDPYKSFCKAPFCKDHFGVYPVFVVERYLCRHSCLVHKNCSNCMNP
jgi:hypothetical protein